ncbi:MAG: hypothetical protein JXR37_04565 [Kiritimatiellae bacterium]|nr:hypothetical protein [Kiritimatiellia bacterium]
MNSRRHRTKRRTRHLAPLAGALLMALVTPATAGAPWQARLVPAALNKDRTVHLVAGHTQPVILMLQASDEERQKRGEHDVDIVLTLPASLRLVDQGGQFPPRAEWTRAPDGKRTVYSLAYKVPNSRLCPGNPGSRLGSVWQSQALYLAAPTRLAEGEAAALELRIEVDGYSARESYEVKLHQPGAPGVQTKLTRIGLWSYNFTRSGKAASEGLAALLQHAGVRHTQSGSGALLPHLRQRGIVHGSTTHHGEFQDPAIPDLRPSGKARDHDFPCPVSAVETYAGDPTKTPGVAALVEGARKRDGIATFDYEPMISCGCGFSPRSLARFKQVAGLTDAQLERWRQAVQEHGKKICAIEDPPLATWYRQWVAFRTDTTAAYVRLIADGFHRLLPEGRLELTPNAGYGRDGVTALACGYDATEMARYVDAILPQIYKGYGAAEAKAAISMVRGWRAELDAKQARAELHPILLVRYAGASVRNSPAYLHLQILGAVAEGAQGVLFFYPDLMDAPYWLQLAETTRILDRYERFYHEGQRVTELFRPRPAMLEGVTEIGVGGLKLSVQNPNWHVTAHRMDDRILLTLFNLQSGNDGVFSLEGPPGWTVSDSAGVEPRGSDWLVAPRSAGFVTLRR